MRDWLNLISNFTAAFSEMIRLAWQAQPAICVALILLTSIDGLLPLAMTWTTKLLLDFVAKGLQGDQTITLRIIWVVVGLVVIFFAGQIIDPMCYYLRSELGRKIIAQVQTRIYKKIGDFQGILYFEEPKFYDTLRLAIRGAENGPVGILQMSLQLFQNFVTLFSFVSIILVLNPLLFVLIILAALPRLYTEFTFGQQRFALATEISLDERRAFYYQGVLSGAEGAKELRLFGIANYFVDALLQTYRKIHGAQAQQQLRELRWTFYQLLVSLVGNSLIFIFFGLVVLRTISGEFSLGDISLYFGTLLNLGGALLRIFNTMSGINEHVLFFSHYKKLMATPEPLALPSQFRPIAPLRSGLEFHNVSFRYTDQHPWVLKNLNLYIPKGQSIALVGVNGAGKTTLIKLLTRLYDPTEGQILWDGIDICEFDVTELRKQMGVVLQDFMQYALTAKENIGLGDLMHLHEMGIVRQAAMDAGVHDILESLPEGYQTILNRWLVEEGVGTDLSTGQWQRVALARLCMRQAQVQILDEPTAALDAQAEYDFFNRFIMLTKDRTSLLISHRFSTVKAADMVAVLEDGCITEYGSHEELMAQQTTYAKLYNLQAERYN